MPPIAYIPPAFRETDQAKLLDFIRERTFGTFVAVLNGEPIVAHAPAILDGDALRFHMAKGNAFLDAARAGAAATAVFQGVDGYISPDWYGVPDQVPTWNYSAVYVRGRLRSLTREELIAQVDALSAAQEARLSPKKPWTRAKMSPGSDERMFAAIEGVELTIGAIEGKFKLSQNKPSSAIEGAAAALDALGQAVLANAMRGR
jgi:transcriptional regulator